MGYDIDPHCSVCDSAFDTVRHRGLLCCNIEDQVMANIGPEILNKVIDDSNMLATNRLMFPKPVVVSKPVETTTCYFVNMGPDDYFVPADGEVFSDGSCLHPRHGPLSRAGYAAVQVDSDGNIIKDLYGCVGRNLPQTPLGSEFAGLSAALDNSLGCTLVMDCQAVISSWRLGFGSAMVRGTSFDHWWKTLLNRHIVPTSRIDKVIKVKAHRHRNQVGDDPAELVRYHGNALADKLAKEGAAFQPSDPIEVQEYLVLHKEVTVVARHLVKTLTDDRVGHLVGISSCTRTTRHKRKRHFNTNGHDFVWRYTTWVCSVCLKRTNDPILGSSLKPCPGRSKIAACCESELNHKMWVAHMVGGGELFYCSVCYAFAETVPRALRWPCKGPPPSSYKAKGFGRIAKSRIRKSWHPNLMHRLLAPVRIN